jgi:hypothetical protein
MMGDTANGSWTSREFAAHIRETEREQRKREDWTLACVAAEFAVKLHEKGMNLEYILGAMSEIFDTPPKFAKRAPYQGEPGLEAHEEEQ